MKYLTIPLLALAVSMAAAQDVKGIRLGMTQPEVEALIPDGPAAFTLAGVKGVYPLELKYEDGKLVELNFKFRTADYFDVLEAARDKYPALSCMESGNMVMCSHQNLSLTNRLGNIRVGMLTLRQPKARARSADF